MPIFPAPTGVPAADEDTPFNKTLAVAGTSEVLVTAPGVKRGRSFSLQNEGPGIVFLQADGVATLTSTEIKKGQTWAEADLDIGALQFIGETGKQPNVHGVLWSGPTA